MATFISQEQRPLKKPRLGAVGPDVYPQDLKQKEDELTTSSVKHGFNNPPVISDEHGSAKNYNINPSKFISFYNGVITKKADLDMYQDQAKRKPQINHKDIFYPVISKTKGAVEAWIKDLAAGVKSLAQLGKKVPIFNKKEDVLTTLCDSKVSMMRACWFIKMTNVYNMAMADATKAKKRHTVYDPFNEWTMVITRHLREQLVKIIEHYQGNVTGTSFLTAGPTSVVDLECPMKNWNYCTNLARYMYEEGLLDQHELLSWFLELLEKQKITDDTVLKLIFAQVMKYTSDFVQSQLLSRKLTHFCARKLSQFCNESSCSSAPRSNSPVVSQSSNANSRSGSATPSHSQHPISSLFAEYNGCPQHRGLILALSYVLQTVAIRCPGALVWHHLGDGKGSSILSGSPLDLLPCAPSCLPMAPGADNQSIRSQIRAAENQIAARGRSAEMKWSSDKCQRTNSGSVISHVLHVLEALDQHNFDRVEANSSLDSLYHRVFSSVHCKDNGSSNMIGDEPVVNLLCEWAVSTQRTGEHRAIVVAKLLEKRQNELASEKFSDPSEMADERDHSVTSGSEMMGLGSGGSAPFQALLMNFLDKKAPLLDDNPTVENKSAFANLILLFCELISNEVFSHDAYICTLISRGDLMQYPSVMPSTSIMASLYHANPDVDLSSVKSESMKQEVSHRGHTPGLAHTPGSSRLSHMPLSVPMSRDSCRHLVYVTHFPIPQDDLYSHECNQRQVLLYGVGKARDEARHIVKKITKEVLKLFSKKNCIEIVNGDSKQNKRKKEKEVFDTVNYEAIFHKFHKLSYYDQHALTSAVSNTIVESFSAFAAGTSVYLPQIENISFLLDLMEFCNHINGLLDFLTLVLKELPDVESQLHQKGSLHASGLFSTNLCLFFVALLRKYHAYLLVSTENTCVVFESLCRVVKHVANPAGCSSSERCILAYLYDVYTKCNFLKLRYGELFGSACLKVQSTVYARVSPTPTNLLWDTAFMSDAFHNPKMKIDQMTAKQINDNPNDRYNFVVNAVLNVCLSGTTSLLRLNDVSILCAEMTGFCNSLSSEWLGVLKALCWSSNHNCGYIDVIARNDINDLSLHDNLAVFTAILVAHHCFTLEDLVSHVALHSLLAACPSRGDQAAEKGARLTCHLLLRLFQSVHVLPGSSPETRKNVLGIKSSCDRHLLEAAHNSITVGAVVAVLKAILMLDSCNSDSRNLKKDGSDDIISSMLSSLDDGMDDLSIGILGRCVALVSLQQAAGLSEYAKHCLKEICSQEWVREKLLKNPENLFDSDLLLDNMLSQRQAQQLVQMICYPGGIPSVLPLDEDDEDEEPEEQRHITRILQNVDLWSLRVSWLELQLMLKQASNSEMSGLIENIAIATIEVFQRQTERKNKLLDNAVASPSNPWHEKENESAWLIAPLISKLSSSVQGKVLRTAGQVLETGNNFWSAKNSKDRERYLLKSTSLLGHQPFLSLVFACLQGQDEQREGLLKSLYDQLDKFVTNTKEQQDRGMPTEDKLKFMMQEALQLRLSLVGGMFDTIQRSNNLRQDWAILLMQLVSHGVVDINNNSELFTIVLDMLSVLIHGTLVSENSDIKGEDNRKHYQQLIRKLKKELGEKHSASIDQCRQLLPLPKLLSEVLQCEPFESDSESNRHKGTANYHDRRAEEGLKICNKQKVSPWEMIEGMKSLTPFSLAWFGAVRLERQPVSFEDEHHRLMYHSHHLKKPVSHFLDAPQLPAEDLEPIAQEKPVGFTFPHNSPILEHVLDGKHPQDKNSKPKRRGSNRRQSPRIGTPTGHSPYMPGPMAGPMGFQRQDMYAQGGQGHNWYPGQNSRPPQQQQQQGQYMQGPPQHLPPGGPRFGPGASISSSSKMALSSYLRARNPNPNYMPQQNPTQNYENMRLMQQEQHQRMIRHRLSSMQNQRNMINRMGSNDGAAYAQQMGNFPPQPMPAQRGYNQGMGGGMGGSQQPGGPQQQPPPQTFNQPFQGSSTSGGGMVGRMPGMAAGGQPPGGPGGYMGQQQGPPLPQSQQYPNTSRFSGMEVGNLSAGAGGMQGGAQSALSMSGGGLSQMPGQYNPQGPQAGYNMQAGGSSGMAAPPNTAGLTQQQRQQVQQRQQMMMQQQQQQHQQQQMQPQMGAATPQQSMYPQMQRQLSGGGGGGNNFNPYQQQY
ncbi:hypothetical protein CAPTEDRAFT_163894 [Capitella teleta]|uniref:Mediator complex subunit Med12 domain-containing protein n=1 Tax=Capitella teleta TaxID=283909 RepID=R7TG52_CAPTE|nr:hypothetical protein CAPTEDRAFT_163894 [Capitella teleta]|eukprot:ELT92763.1 hypothetical protein CAPTEDRAFT_163894 [Capitella teleta]